MELFDKFYKTVKPTDDRMYKKIINFTKNIDQRLDDTNKYNTIADQNVTSSSIFTRSKFENTIIHKLGYEWKNIYRNLTLIDSDSTGEVTLAQFEKACAKQQVSLSEYETRKLYSQYGEDKCDKLIVYYK